MNNSSIGILDTGAGGLATMREIKRLLPGENTIYLGDTANAPYGSHSKELIAGRAARGLAFLQQQDVKLIVSTSGTICTALPATVTKGLSVPFINTLLPCVQEACALSVHGVIGAIGDTATIRSSVFGKTVRSIRTDARVIGKACPLFVPLAENGALRSDNHLLRLAIKQYLEPMLGDGIDTLILGSPHYSVLFAAISDVLGYDVTLIDAATVTARFVQSCLLQNSMQNDGKTLPPKWFVTDAPEDFMELSKLYYGEEIKQNVIQVNL